MHHLQQTKHRNMGTDGHSLREVFSQEYPVDHGSKSDQIYVRCNRHKAVEIWQQKDNALLKLLRHHHDIPYPNMSDLLLGRTKVPEHATNCLYRVDGGEEEGISVEGGFCYRQYTIGTMSPSVQTNNF